MLLNGPPSTGKTTLAQALQERLETPYFHLSLDQFRAGYADRHWRTDDGTLFQSTLTGYLASLRALVGLGHRVIAEAVMTPERLGTYLDVFEAVPVLLIGVHCPVEIAQQRERSRLDRRRPLDLAVPAYDLVHSHGGYDVDVDTSRCTPAEAASAVAQAIAEWPAPGAFEQLGQRRRQQGLHFGR